MIVVSGVLVLVALVFLIIGLFGDGLTFIWASIVTSIVAGVFLLLGALQRRGTPATTADTGASETDMLERVTAVSVRPRGDEAAGTADDADLAGVTAAAATSGEVAVVPGRPRYHTASCRFLAGRPDVETISLDDAKGEGYTACGVCKPDAAVAAAAAASSEPPVAEQAATGDETAAIGTADIEATAPAPIRARKAPAKKATATRAARGTAGTTALDAGTDTGTADTLGDTAGDTTGAAAAATATPTKAARATKATAGTTATTAAKSTAAAKPAAGAATVVAVPDRGKFHTETCRFASAPGALTMSKTAAKRQGLAPCGVCKP